MVIGHLDFTDGHKRLGQRLGALPSTSMFNVWKLKLGKLQGKLLMVSTRSEFSHNTQNCQCCHFCIAS